MPLPHPRNIVLIGMPGVGKSTVGVLLAKVLARTFVDTDLLLQAGEGRPLQELVNELGKPGFCALEERYVCALTATAAVIATGGSVVYEDRAMQHLQAHGLVLWLALPLPVLRQRLANLAVRGVVMAAGQDLAALAAEREPRYRRYAELTVNCDGLHHEQVVAAVLQALPESLRRGPYPVAAPAPGPNRASGSKTGTGPANQ